MSMFREIVDKMDIPDMIIDLIEDYLDEILKKLGIHDKVDEADLIIILEILKKYV
jgi:hypothetical protein